MAIMTKKRLGDMLLEEKNNYVLAERIVGKAEVFREKAGETPYWREACHRRGDTREVLEKQLSIERVNLELYSNMRKDDSYA